jgi:hypothetical protein
MNTKERVSLFEALRVVGFRNIEPRHLKRGRAEISVRFGNGAHWYVNTPYGTKDYRDPQKAALHAMVLYKLLNRDDLIKMSEFGFLPAKEELENLQKTNYRALKLMSVGQKPIAK